MPKRRPPATDTPDRPFLDAWRKLTPEERLKRSWRMRRLLKNPAAIHDAKSLPRL